jgi:ribosome-binding factor A
MSVHGHRVERLADQIRDDIAEMLAGELKDPRIGLATVTRVELSGDFGHARVGVSVLGDEAARSEALEGLASAKGYVRRQLSRRLGLRRVPELIFILDHGAEDLLRVEAALDELKEGKS